MLVQRKLYIIKQLDEFGNIIYEQDNVTFKNRQTFVRGWRGKDKVQFLKEDNIIILVKPSGEELWLYEQ